MSVNVYVHALSVRGRGLEWFFLITRGFRLLLQDSGDNAWPCLLTSSLSD